MPRVTATSPSRSLIASRRSAATRVTHCAKSSTNSPAHPVAKLQRFVLEQGGDDPRQLGQWRAGRGLPASPREHERPAAPVGDGEDEVVRGAEGSAGGGEEGVDVLLARLVERSAAPGEKAQEAHAAVDRVTGAVDPSGVEAAGFGAQASSRSSIAVGKVVTEQLSGTFLLQPCRPIPVTIGSARLRDTGPGAVGSLRRRVLACS